MAFIPGDAGDNFLPGTEDNDTILGEGGNDSLFGNGGGDRLEGGIGNDLLQGGAGADTLIGGDGVDTVSYYTSALSVFVNLGSNQAFGGDADGDQISGFENLDGSNAGNDVLNGSDGNNVLQGFGGTDLLRGGGGDDRLYGGDAIDTLEGGAGADTLDGGDHPGDVAVYYDSGAGVTVDLSTGRGHGGEAEGDVLVNIEDLEGSALNDTLTGSDVDNELNGREGDNTLYGRGGDDRLIGWDGNDVLAGGSGADTLAGNGGIDTIDYRDSHQGVTIDLVAGTGVGGDAQGDTIFEVENVNGSGFADNLTGDGGSNVLDGGAGNDLLAGGDGDDVLRGGAAGDHLDGGGGTDTASYFTSTTGVTVSLAAGTGSSGDAAGDTLTGIENLAGSRGSDTLSGDGGANALRGWNGNDVLRGAGGADTLTGGAGADRFVYSAVGESVVGANADRITDFSHAQGDRIDLSGLDANTGTAGNQAFHFIGTAAYTHHAGELRFAFNSADTVIAGDVNGDGTSDFHIVLTGHVALAAGDFVL